MAKTEIAIIGLALLIAGLAASPLFSMVP